MNLSTPKRILRKAIHFGFIGSALLLTSHTYAQAPPIEWERTYGGTKGDYLSSIIKVNNGYVAVGYTASNDSDITGFHGGPTTSDGWVVKLNETGSVIWKKCLGGSGDDILMDVKQTPDNGYVLAGYTASIDGDIYDKHGTDDGYYDAWVVKLDSLGAIQWSKCYGGSVSDNATSIQLTSDGGYIIGGATNSPNDGDVSGYHVAASMTQDCWIVKLNDTGKIMWAKCYGGSGNDGVISSTQSVNDGYVFAAMTASSDGDVAGQHGNDDIWILNINDTGAIVWTKCYGGTDYDKPYSIMKTGESGYIFAGGVMSNDGDVSGNHGGNGDAWVVKLNNSGSIIWQKTYGGSGRESAININIAHDNDYIVAGTTNSTDGDVTDNHGNMDMWVWQLNDTGKIVWQKTMGGPGVDYANAVITTTDGYAVAGYAGSSGGNIAQYKGGVADCWVVKLSDSTSSVENVQANNFVKIYPTVTDGKINVILSEGYENAAIKMVNIFGQSVNINIDGTGLKRVVYMPQVSAGIYVLQVINKGTENSYRLVYRP